MRNRAIFFPAAILTWCMLCFPVVFAGCKKGEITGRVTNEFDGTPVEGILVGVDYSKTVFFSLKSGSLPLATSDANGEFKIDATYLNKKKYKYRISLKPKEYGGSIDTLSEILRDYSFSPPESYPVNQTKDLQHFEFKVAPMARLQIKAKNVPPADSSDWISVKVLDEFVGDGSWELFGMGNGYTPPGFFYYQVRTNGNVRLMWSVRENGQETHYYDTIAVAPFTKLTYYINY